VKNRPPYDVDYFDTFYDLLKRIETRGPQPAVTWFDRKQNRHDRNCAQLYNDAEALRRYLMDSGYAGKHISIVSENCYDWIVVLLGIVSAGAVAVCVDVEQSDDVIREYIEISDSAAVFASPSYRDICAPAVCGDMALWEMNGAADSGEAPSLKELIEAGDKLPDPGKNCSADDTAVIVFTSGTTSRAKPVMLTHKNILHNSAAGLSLVDLHKDIFSALPFYHSYGLNCFVVACMIWGARCILNGDMRTMLRDIGLSSPYSMIAVPLMAEAIYKYLWVILEKGGKADEVRRKIKIGRRLAKLGIKSWNKALVEFKKKYLGDLSLMIAGGAHLDKEVAEGLLDFGILVLPGYGITECSPLISVNQVESRNFESVGHVLPGVDVRIKDGEILVRGSNVMKGYYNSPEQTAECMEGEWFHTGDLGSIDRNGFLYITGRIKNLIVLKNGKKISPEKLEELIQKIPLVKEVIAYGANSGSSADDVRPAASIYPDPELTKGMSSYEILEALQKEIDRINASLPLYQQIQIINIREKEFARTPSKKIIRSQV
jgi:long-chain acyl-CoA synthetase